MDSRKLLEAALALTPEERADLAHDLLSSLDDSLDADRDVTWLAEIQRRAEAVADGSATPVDWSEARARILDRLRAIRG
jgi:putative addiction module component (TIGR02574 family)